MMGNQGERVTLSVIRETYFRGDFEVCLAQCEAFKTQDARDVVEVALLQARCLIPLDRGAQAIEVMRSLRLADDQHDEDLTARMLDQCRVFEPWSDPAWSGHGTQSLRRPRTKPIRVVRAELTVHLGVAHCRNGEICRC